MRASAAIRVTSVTAEEIGGGEDGFLSPCPYNKDPRRPAHCGHGFIVFFFFKGGSKRGTRDAGHAWRLRNPSVFWGLFLLVRYVYSPRAAPPPPHSTFTKVALWIWRNMVVASVVRCVLKALPNCSLDGIFLFDQRYMQIYSYSSSLACLIYGRWRKSCKYVVLFSF